MKNALRGDRTHDLALKAKCVIHSPNITCLTLLEYLLPLCKLQYNCRAQVRRDSPSPRCRGLARAQRKNGARQFPHNRTLRDGSMVHRPPRSGRAPPHTTETQRVRMGLGGLGHTARCRRRGRWPTATPRGSGRRPRALAGHSALARRGPCP
jgi:hypothetical protein